MCRQRRAHKASFVDIHPSDGLGADAADFSCDSCVADIRKIQSLRGGDSDVDADDDPRGVTTFSASPGFIALGTLWTRYSGKSLIWAPVRPFPHRSSVH